MPMITVQFAPVQRKAGLVEAVAKAANALSAEFLHKDPSITAVAVEERDPATWFIGNKPLSEQGLASFWLDIRVVDGTNTREEKAAFIAATFAKMRELIGPLHNEAYVYVNEVRGDAYGYGGLTQNERYIPGKLRTKAKAA
ncbi:MAG TPA: 4-oxalocrotonate tautomerase family protein [Pseudolabrys sp.]|nr:4-oxalocrotonate tautomerase family protein [Pseudolabrys sp.]